MDDRPRHETEPRHPADVAAALEQMSEEDARQAFASLDSQTAARVIASMNPERAALLLQQLHDAGAAELLQEVAPDDAADVLGQMPTDAAESVLGEMVEPGRSEVGHLLAYSEDVAGAIMTTEVTPIPESLSAQEAIEFIRAHAGPREAVYYAYVVDVEGRLLRPGKDGSGRLGGRGRSGLGLRKRHQMSLCWRDQSGRATGRGGTMPRWSPAAGLPGRLAGRR